MPKNGKPFIFSTRNLEPGLVDKLTSAGIHYEGLDFIKVSNEYDSGSFIESLQSTETQARVFTSKNAVISLLDLLKKYPLKIPPKKTFTVGVKATEMLAEAGIKSDARAANAISLAQIIARNKDVKAVDFFCGNKSLDDLPEYLESKKVSVHKEIVYKTDLVTESVETDLFDGIIFLSPTAVFSFFKKNKIDLKIPAFCIGATTSDAVHLRCENKRVESDEPSIESVVDKVIDHFQVVKT